MEVKLYLLVRSFIRARRAEVLRCFSAQQCVGVAVVQSSSIRSGIPLGPHVFTYGMYWTAWQASEGEGDRRERGRGREKGRGECVFLPLPSPAPYPFCAPMFSSGYVLDCVAGVRRRGRGGGERRERGRERRREKGRGECAFIPLPSPAPSPFCAPMFSSEYVLDCVVGVGRRGRGEGRRGRGGEEEKKEEGNALFSPSPSPALSPLCACHED